MDATSFASHPSSARNEATCQPSERARAPPAASHSSEMSVLLETSVGDFVVDLHVEECPLACRNFLKLCKAKRYNGCLFFDVQRDFLVQTGDPANKGTGGESIYGLLYGAQARYFEHEIRLPQLSHARAGTVGMASAGTDQNASQFYITMTNGLHRLDGKHTVFGEVGEGMDTLQKINETLCDEAGRPWQNIRIKHTLIIDDPFVDPPGMEELIPDKSPVWVPDPDDDRLEEDWKPEEVERDPEEIEKKIREQEAKSRAVVLEMIGDLPSADVAPPENVLFVCKLNPVTSDDDLEIIFSRFGKILSCDIVRDKATGDSLCYGFIAFEDNKSAEEAYFKMNNVLIDDRRILVDFSQSVSHLWNKYHRHGKRGSSEDAHMARRSRGRDTGDRVHIKRGAMDFHPKSGSHQLLLDPEKVRESREHGAREARSGYPSSSGKQRDDRLDNKGRQGSRGDRRREDNDRSSHWGRERYEQRTHGRDSRESSYHRRDHSRDRHYSSHSHHKHRRSRSRDRYRDYPPSTRRAHDDDRYNERGHRSNRR